MIREITEIGLPADIKYPYVIHIVRRDKDGPVLFKHPRLNVAEEAGYRHELREPLYVHSANQLSLWVVPVTWAFPNHEKWQWTVNCEGTLKVYLVYRSWAKKRGRG